MVSFKKKLRLVANSVYPSANILLSSKPLIEFDPPNLINSLLTKFFEFIFSLTIEDSNLNLEEKLNFLITGEKPTKRKVEEAKHLNIKIINQDEFLKLINKTS